jgi:hypothetical protein
MGGLVLLDVVDHGFAFRSTFAFALSTSGFGVNELTRGHESNFEVASGLRVTLTNDGDDSGTELVIERYGEFIDVALVTYKSII